MQLLQVGSLLILPLALPTFTVVSLQLIHTLRLLNAAPPSVVQLLVVERKGFYRIKESLKQDIGTLSAPHLDPPQREQAGVCPSSNTLSIGQKQSPPSSVGLAVGCPCLAFS